MKGVILFFLALTACATAQNCQKVFSEYLECIDTEVDRSYPELERELESDFRKEVHRCFSTVDNPSSTGKCYLKPGSFEDVFGATGPLEECSICQKVAKFIKKIFFESDERSMRCVRHVLRDAIQADAEHCISEKLNRRFTIQNIPDFDRQAASHRHLVVSRRCASTFDTVQNYACKCFNEKREEIKSQIRQLPRKISNLLQRYGQNSPGVSRKCVQEITSLLKTTSGVDWKDVIDSGISRCLRGQLPRIGRKELNVDTMLDLGCRLAIRQFGNGGLKQLAIGTRFLQVVVDALVARINRFCGGDHCQ